MNTSNSNKSENSRGILAFATNTADTNYVEIANRTLPVASKILNIPYKIITGSASEQNFRFDIDQQKFVSWNNLDRYMAYDLSPYDETIVIDVDYLVLDNTLSKIFDCSWDYVIQRHSSALTQEWPNIMGPNSLPFVWATVFAFRKTTRAKLFFDLIKRIQNNYSYYFNLFNVRERNYRNDYAFAMADYILNGYRAGTNTIPGTMLTVDQTIESMQLTDHSVIIRDQERGYVVPRTNLHIMSKKYLLGDNFDQFVKQL